MLLMLIFAPILRFSQWLFHMPKTIRGIVLRRGVYEDKWVFYMSETFMGKMAGCECLHIFFLFELLLIEKRHQASHKTWRVFLTQQSEKLVTLKDTFRLRLEKLFIATMTLKNRAPSNLKKPDWTGKQNNLDDLLSV